MKFEFRGTANLRLSATVPADASNKIIPHYADLNKILLFKDNKVRAGFSLKCGIK